MKNVTTFDELIDRRQEKSRPKKRTEFEIKTKAFPIGETIKEELRLANMTQDELAETLFVYLVRADRKAVCELTRPAQQPKKGLIDRKPGLPTKLFQSAVLTGNELP